MKWRTKKRLYAYNNFVAKNFVVINKGIILLSMLIIMLGCLIDMLQVILEGKSSITLNTIIGISIIDIILLFSVFLFPEVLGVIAIRNSFKRFPVLKKLKLVTNFKLDMIGRPSYDQLLQRLEGSFHEQSEDSPETFVHTKALIQNYMNELNHISEIANNRKEFDEDIVQHAAIRANTILLEINETLKDDEKLHQQMKEQKTQQFVQEWDEVYKKKN